jgi:hypothetical protein
VRLRRIETALDAHAVSPEVAADGVFRTQALADGVWEIDIEAVGYARLRGTVQIPHRGEWANMHARLSSLRGAAYDAYRPAAVMVLGSAERALHATPQETLEHARRSGRATTTLGKLTQRLERAAYDRSVPAESDLSAIARDTHEAVHELGPANPASKDEITGRGAPR